ncbi:diaminopropionate ammonia-lyase [Propionimicrobium sp. PCR01-08-3]|uniref:diaminopropionate ammonia-lyase n=1 Tax=Propionimicrobium sp. PCR01-08-3 TaxID=3052086 RepID=UPI00255CC2B7|nr:diaminopropionate ammonia-lyase [Propionimicrobium sp. PCR01-08-3]WIY82527.1 diaminopropionate ammonia-lyase [Propionimicrobium sp. PCR01-08-3]
MLPIADEAVGHDPSARALAESRQIAAPGANYVLRNPLADRTAAGLPDAVCRGFHASLPGFAATPVREALATAEALGVAKVLVKDESDRLGLPSFKILGAAWAVCRELAERWRLGDAAGLRFDDLVRAAVDHPGLTLVAPTDGNHGRAVAHMASLLGLPAVVLMPAGTAQDRIDAIAAEGAEVRVTEFGYDDTVRMAAAMADDTHAVISDTSWPEYTRAPQDVIDGYATVVGEVTDLIAAGALPEPDVVAAQIGVGGFAAAVARGFAHRPGRLMVGVEPLDAACVTASVAVGRIISLPGEQRSAMAGLNCGTPSDIAWPDISTGFDAFSVIDDASAEQAMRLLAEDGIAAGESGAAGLAGLLGNRGDLGLTSSDTVLVFLTEGPTDARNYRRVVGGMEE